MAQQDKQLRVYAYVLARVFKYKSVKKLVILANDKKV